MDGQQQYADAMRAFDAYYGTRRSVLGLDWPAKRYADHRSWKAFLKLAEKCDKAGRDVEKFVTTVLEHMPKNGNEVVPNDLVGKRAEALWEAHKNDDRVDAGKKWAYLVQQVIQIQGVTGQTDEAILLTSLNAQFPAWFRVLYPDNINNLIVEAWGEEALDELKEDRDLVRFLRAAMAGKMESFERKMGVIDGI